MKCIRPFHHKSGIQFPCRQCNSCRIDHSRLWTGRIILESRLHEHNCFATLTYSPEALPEGGTLVERHHTLFLKKLRKQYPSRAIRYFGVGEYGDESGRPHYHYCLFGVSIADHEQVASAWVHGKDEKFPAGTPRGFIKLDELNEGTAGYISQYVLKKWTNKHDLRVLAALNGRAPEFARMSLHPGLGAGAAPIIADAIAGRDIDIPSRLRVDGQLRPLGRYIKKKVIERFPNAKALANFEKTVWLRKVHEDYLVDQEEAKKAGKTMELYRWEKRRQRFLNLRAKHKIYKAKRTL